MTAAERGLKQRISPIPIGIYAFCSFPCMKILNKTAHKAGILFSCLVRRLAAGRLLAHELRRGVGFVRKFRKEASEIVGVGLEALAENFVGASHDQKSTVVDFGHNISQAGKDPVFHGAEQHGF